MGGFRIFPRGESDVENPILGNPDPCDACGDYASPPPHPALAPVMESGHGARARPFRANVKDLVEEIIKVLSAYPHDRGLDGLREKLEPVEMEVFPELRSSK